MRGGSRLPFADMTETGDQPWFVVGLSTALAAGAARTALAAAPRYARHVPERTLLYALAQAH
jgi:hypothetical protein